MRAFDSLSEREILALAISLEEEDERVYADFAEGLRQDFPATAAIFDGMREEESGHRRRLIELFQRKFGDHIPLIRRQDVRGFVNRKPVWLIRPLGLDIVRNAAASMEIETRQFYEKAAARTADAHIRQLLDDLAQEERSHEERAEALEEDKLGGDVRMREDQANRRLFVLQIVQPGLAGLMDGSVSTRPRYSPRPSPPTSQRTRSWWVWRLHWAQASAWVSRKRFPTMEALPAAATPGCAAWSAA